MKSFISFIGHQGWSQEQILQDPDQYKTTKDSDKDLSLYPDS